MAGAVCFAVMSLDLSRPWVTRTEVELESWPESDPGLAVGPDSAWIRICLPGDDAWPSDIRLPTT